MTGKLRNLTCCCCGAEAGRYRQHWNRDTGFGMCAKCIAWVRDRGMPEAEIHDLYGVEGVNYAPNATISDDVRKLLNL